MFEDFLVLQLVVGPRGSFILCTPGHPGMSLSVGRKISFAIRRNFKPGNPLLHIPRIPCGQFPGPGLRTRTRSRRQSNRYSVGDTTPQSDYSSFPKSRRIRRKKLHSPSMAAAIQWSQSNRGGLSLALVSLSLICGIWRTGRFPII